MFTDLEDEIEDEDDNQNARNEESNEFDSGFNEDDVTLSMDDPILRELDTSDSEVEEEDASDISTNKGIIQKF